MTKQFEIECKEYIDNCGYAFSDDVKRSMIQSACSADKFNNYEYLAERRRNALKMLFTSARELGWSKLNKE